jgi:thioredoxin 1
MSGWLQVHPSDFHRRLAALPGRTLVLFGQDGCGACRRAEALLPRWLDGLVQQRVKVDAAEQAALAREFAVFHLPALHLFVEGRYHAPIECVLAADALRAAIEQAAAAPPCEAP